MRTPSILVWMALAIGAVTALAYWDEERESKAALDDFAQEQTTLAVATAAALGDKQGAPNTTDARPEQLLSSAKTIERPGAVRVLLGTADARDARADELTGSDGSHVRLAALSDAIHHGASSVRLTRPEAAQLGLPARTAIAGLSRASGSAGRFTVVVVATAQAERDRELRARWRLVLGVVVASGLVVAFGGLAMRKQKQELVLAHQLALSRLQTERDERLVRADKLATMGALATGIAHEVSTPLGVILGRAEQLLPKQTDERSRRAVETIAAQIERINAVIRGFLALARGNEPALEHGEPDRLARAALELVEHRFEKARVRLALDVAPDLPRVACDPRLFEQVLVNLLLNACDACREGGLVTLEVRARGREGRDGGDGGDGGDVAFLVTDDGVGIRPDAAQRVTEPFFTTKPEGEGTGLGLAIASEIVKHHRGSLTLRPRTGGQGTCASVELPAVAHEADGCVGSVGSVGRESDHG